MYKVLRIVYFICIGLLFYACSKDEVPSVEEYKTESGVFVINEGNFTYGNASLSFFDLQNNEYQIRYFTIPTDFHWEM